MAERSRILDIADSSNFAKLFAFTETSRDMVADSPVCNVMGLETSELE
jgi:hypothetical protein